MFRTTTGLASGLLLALSVPALAQANESAPPATNSVSAAAASAPAAADTAQKEVTVPAAATAAEPATTSAMTESPDAKSAAAAEKAATNDDPVICKRQSETGTRLKTTKICYPKSVWDKQTASAKEYMKAVEKSNAPGIGGH